MATLTTAPAPTARIKSTRTGGLDPVHAPARPLRSAVERRMDEAPDLTAAEYGAALKRAATGDYSY